MKKVLLTTILLSSFFCLIGQDTSFEFTAKMKAEVQLGKDWDFSYSELKTPLKVSFSENRLYMVYESGKVYWDLIVLDVKETKTAVENGKTVERHLALEYKEKNGFTSYILFEYKNDFGDEFYTLKIPYNSSGWIFSYNYYSN